MRRISKTLALLALVSAPVFADPVDFLMQFNGSGTAVAGYDPPLNYEESFSGSFSLTPSQLATDGAYSVKDSLSILIGEGFLRGFSSITGGDARLSSATATVSGSRVTDVSVVYSWNETVYTGDGQYTDSFFFGTGAGKFTYDYRIIGYELHFIYGTDSASGTYSVESVPEPSSEVLTGLAACLSGLWIRRKRQNTRR